MKWNLIKKIALCIMVLGLGAGVANAQTDWKGPKAKNRKLWKDPKPATTLYLKTGTSTSLKGPEAKQVRPFDRRKGAVVAVEYTEREILKGPEAKNKKLWRN